MRTLRTGVATAVTAAATTVFLGCGTAYACSCRTQTAAEQYAAATDVFTGTPTSRRDGDGVVYTFRVDSVEKGDVGSVAEVTVRRSSTDCGFEFADGATYQVYAFDDGGTLRTNQCSGSRRLAAGSTPFRPASPGAPTPSTPSTGGAVTPSGSSPAVAVTSSPSGASFQPVTSTTSPRPVADRPGDEDGVPAWLVIGLVGGGAVLGAVVTYLARRRGGGPRRSRPRTSPGAPSTRPSDIR